MKKSEEFFGANHNRVSYLCTQLADEESVDTYKRAILYRGSHNYKERPKYNRKNQYFPDFVVQYVKQHNIIVNFCDCGAYNGDSIEVFLKNMKGQVGKIVAFEPDADNVLSLKKVSKKIIVINAAVWEKNTWLHFSDGAGSSSTVCETGNKMIEAMAIDSVEECKDINFLKMDIEGSEYNALIGAKRLICKNMPILAICIYHSDEDMIRIFELIKTWNLDYKYYVRHHAQKTSETVLYAIPNR